MSLYDKELKDKFKQKSKQKNIKDVIVVDEKSAIVILSKNIKEEELEQKCWYQPVILCSYSDVNIYHNNIAYQTLDQALVALVCLRKNCVHAAFWIGKMLDLDIGSRCL